MSNKPSRKEFKRATHCHICREPLGDEKPVMDHDHLTGVYRGAAHSSCNLGYKFKENVPVVFHNLKGYDGHLLMKAVGNHPGRRLNVIPKSMEQYLSFSLGRLRFIDSLSFLSQSLANLVQSVGKDGDSAFVNTKEAFPSKYPLLLRKGVYPYEYMDAPSKFEERRSLPKPPSTVPSPCSTSPRRTMPTPKTCGGRLA